MRIVLCDCEENRQCEFTCDNNKGILKGLAAVLLLPRPATCVPEVTSKKIPRPVNTNILLLSVKMAQTNPCTPAKVVNEKLTL